jgi:hypothetical protein
VGSVGQIGRGTHMSSPRSVRHSTTGKFGLSSSEDVARRHEVLQTSANGQEHKRNGSFVLLAVPSHIIEGDFISWAKQSSVTPDSDQIPTGMYVIQSSFYLLFFGNMSLEPLSWCSLVPRSLK